MNAAVAEDYDAKTTATCLLEEDDMQCGHIFFSETSRVLKFFCTYCRETYDNINYFCDHLSAHLTNEDDINDAVGKTDATEIGEMFINNSDNESEPFDAGDFETFDRGAGMIVEELDEAAEIAAEVEDEMRQALVNRSTFMHEGEDNSCASDFLGYDEETVDGDTTMPVSNQDEQIDTELAMTDNDFENMIRASRIEESFSDVRMLPTPTPETDLSNVAKQLQKPKKKRVKTIKVIAIRNRIAELYTQIKTQEELRLQEKSSQLQVADNANKKPQTNDNGDEQEENCREENADNDDHSNDSQAQSKVIGETIITHIPHGANLITSSAKQAAYSTLSKKAAHQNTNEKDCTCPACGKRFRNAFSLSIHKRTHYLETNSEIKLAHKCSDCDQLFNKVADMKEHLQKVHYPDGFLCKICQRKLSSIAQLEMHMRKKHLTRPFNCKICDKDFDNRKEFEEHISVHVEGQHYKCRICGRKYDSEVHLQQHMLRHKAQVPQCCVVCGKMTLRITQHMKVHTPRPTRILSCRICGKEFNFSSGLSQHYRYAHEEPPLLPRIKSGRSQLKDSSTKQAVDKTSLLIDDDEYDDDDNEEQTDEVSQELKHTKEQLQQTMDDKEAEAKRVIVELIQNATYNSFFPANSYTQQTFENAPPIAREETITAVNSIVHDR